MNFKTYNLTQSQKRIIDSSERIGNRCLVYKLTGKIDTDKLAWSVKVLTDSCDPFSYRFLRLNNETQILHGSVSEAQLRIINAKDEVLTFSIIEGLCLQKFQPDIGAPYLFALVQNPHAHYLVFSCHPALMDRFSLKPLMQSLSDIYNSPDLTQSFNKQLGLSQEELLEQERKRLASIDFQDSIRFWLQIIRDTFFEWLPPRHDTAIDESYFSTILDSTSTADLKFCARELNLTNDSLLKLCFHVLMSRVCRNDTILTSYFHQIRFSDNSTEPIGIGFSENKLALKSVVPKDITLSQFFIQASKLISQMKYHSQIPSQSLAEQLLPLEPNYKRATNLLFSADTLPYDELNLNLVSAQLLPVFSYRLEEEDVAIHFDIKETISFHTVARSPQYIPGMKLIFEHFKVFLSQLKNQLYNSIQDIQFYDELLSQKAAALEDGGSLDEAPLDFMRLFVDAVKLNPNSHAITFQNETLSYQDFYSAASRVAAGLAKYTGLVGICLPRSEKSIISIFGILGAGLGYLPLDPTMPMDRLKFIAKDAKLTTIIVDSETQKLFSPMNSLKLLNITDLIATKEAENFPIISDSSSTAYVIYTSGTTGTPKGVVITRKNLSHLLASLKTVWPRGPGFRFSQFAAFTFDASVLSIFNPLVHGSELILTPSEVRADPEALFQMLLDKKVTHADLPPAMLPLLPRRPLPDLKVVIAGGEVIDEATVRFWSKTVILANCYGPTEATVLCTWNRLEGHKSANQLGRPIPGYSIYLLDDNGLRVPIGGVGEIYIGGDGVGKEYLGRPDLTASKFTNHPLSNGRLYRTGDLARYLPNGDLEFLGRNDFQVKIRGFRIELGDIETAISTQPEVKMTYVGVIDRDGQKTLVAWYRAIGLSAAELKKRLGGLLPHYMVPTFLIPVETFPTTLSGKIDRAALPMPLFGEASGSEIKWDDFQLLVSGVWSHVLKIPQPSIAIDSHFFQLGGHSLLAASVCNELSTRLKTRVRPKLLFEYPSFAAFCEQLRGVSKNEKPMRPITPTLLRSAPVENRMLGLMFSRAMSIPDDNTYNIVTRVEFSKGIEAEHLRMVFQQIIDENPIFKSSFQEKSSRLFVNETIAETPKVPLILGHRASIEARVQEMRSLSLGITQAPLWRAEVVKDETGCSSLLFCIHHGIFDGWSLNLMMDELAKRYISLRAGTTYSAVKRLSLFDYGKWSDGISQSPEFLEAINYWRKKLSGGNAHIEMPYEATQKRGNSNVFLPLSLSKETTTKLNDLAKQYGTTLSPLLFSIFLVWLWRITNQDELIIGYPYASRDLPGMDEIYGAFIKVGFLRQTLIPENEFHSLALSVHKQMMNDKDHFTAAPYDAEIPGMDGLNIIFSLQSGIGLQGKIGEADFYAEELPSLTAKGDISGVFYENSNGTLSGRIEYDASFFNDETMKGFLKNLIILFDSVALKPNQRISELKYLSTDEHRHLLNLSSGPSAKAINQSIPDRFYKIVEDFGSKTAVIFKDRKLTYSELNKKSNQLAAKFIDKIPVTEPVGVCMAKGENALITILALLKLGAIYVPLDLTYPLDRLEFFIKNSKLKFIVADESGRDKLKSTDSKNLTFFDSSIAESLSDSKPRAISYESLAYIIHTSGSTGIPKGVVVEHQSVVRMVLGAATSLFYDSTATSPLYGPLSFDTSIIEIFLPLLNGATLTIVPEEDRKDPESLHRFLKTQAVTHAILSPVMMQNLPREALPDLKIFGFGGDTIDEATALWWSQHTRLFSCYGPTETTVQSSVGEIKPGSNPRIIGKPAPYYKMYLLNPVKQFVPRGAIGEIYIGGDQCARGYVNREDLTRERFTLDPFSSSPYSLMYRSGDLGRFLNDGTIEYLGRNDTQIKLRGFRIELGEIENRLSLFHGIQHIACAIKGDGQNRYLAAYYVSDTKIDIPALRLFLAGSLPDYMIPSFFVALESLPTSVNGKIDRKLLPAVTQLEAKNPPHQGLEQAIAKIWEAVLNLKGISRDDSFFHLGGNSLLAVRLQAELKKQLGFEMSIGDLYTSPTIEALAAKRTVDFIELACLDAKKSVLVDSEAKPWDAHSKIETLLLTGARGFLGIFILAELTQKLDRIFCLLRCASEEEGTNALKRESLLANIKIDFNKVTVIPGDLGQPGLGINARVYDSLAEQADGILHCGAFVHHLHNYLLMKTTNVDGTKELLKLALHKKQKPFTFVSTLTVGAALDKVEFVNEAILPNRPVTDSGYILTKWVGEQLVADAHSRYELPVIIARPGNITGSSLTGFTNYANNHFWHFNKGCLQLGAYPDVPATIEMMPVDMLAKSIVALSCHPKKEILVANLSNPKTLSQSEFFDLAQNYDLPTKKLNPIEWQKFLPKIKEDNGLFTIREFYMGDITGPIPKVEHSVILQRLKDLGINLNVDYSQLLKIYLAFLKKEGFLPSKISNQL